MEYDPENDFSGAPEDMRGQIRWGFPMDFEAYNYDRELPPEGETDGVVLWIKEDDVLDKNKQPTGKRKAVVSIGCDGPEGRLRIEYHAAEKSGYLNQFVKCVLPEQAVKGKKLNLLAARGRLVRFNLVHDEWDGKWRAKIKGFLPEVSKERLALGITKAGEAAPQQQQAQAPAAAPARNPFARPQPQEAAVADDEIPF